ncbi:hypothetical protein E3N88_29981 [Mikania micrantha]|uniref:Uncharacterized protein n=1 Tax=Mikania micrantha TaxID=192012 RepID=A0A5N6MKX1_9ASTR|nr:hypothetical protein E3N88_29981 [Mikania micrantha]
MKKNVYGTWRLIRFCQQMLPTKTKSDFLRLAFRYTYLVKSRFENWDVSIMKESISKNVALTPDICCDFPLDYKGWNPDPQLKEGWQAPKLTLSKIHINQEYKGESFASFLRSLDLCSSSPEQRTVPTLVARVARHDHQLHQVRSHIDTAPSNTTVRALEYRVQILEGQVLTMEEEHYLDDQALHTMHARLSSIEEDISTMRQRLTTMEHKALTAEQQLATSESRAESATALAIVFLLLASVAAQTNAFSKTPQQMKSAAIEQLVDQRVANAIADYEANRANGVGGSGTGGGGAGGSHTDGSGPDRGKRSKRVKWKSWTLN